MARSINEWEGNLSVTRGIPGKGPGWLPRLFNGLTRIATRTFEVGPKIASCVIEVIDLEDGVPGLEAIVLGGREAIILVYSRLRD